MKTSISEPLRQARMNLLVSLSLAAVIGLGLVVLNVYQFSLEGNIGGGIFNKAVSSGVEAVPVFILVTYLIFRWGRAKYLKLLLYMALSVKILSWLVLHIWMEGVPLPDAFFLFFIDAPFLLMLLALYFHKEIETLEKK